MDIAEHTDQPISIDLDGESYGFSELSIEGLGRLQAWIKRASPHPIEAVKPHLKGLEPADRAALLADARRAAESWPPEIGTGAAAQVLLGREEGRVETLWEALKVHQPQTTREAAARLARRLRRVNPDGGTLARVFRIALGIPESADSDDAADSEDSPGVNGDPKD